MNQWRAETAVRNIPGILGDRSYLIPDDKLTQEVAVALGQMEQDTGSKIFTKVEIRLILHLTRSAGFLRMNGNETARFDDFVPSRYITPDKDWLPPYPYCTGEVLFLAE